jgi:SpoVK/Ycf46/Vps4 family AAA+-type ATPase
MSKIQDSMAKLKKAKNKNDLFESTADGQDILKAYKALKEDGLSKKTLNKTKNLDLKLKTDLNLTNEEYIILLPLLNDKSRGVEVSDIIKLVNGNDGLSGSLYNKFFDMYKRKLIDITPQTSSIGFKLSNQFLNYLTTGETKFEVVEYPLKSLIADMDTIANLYTSSNSYARSWGDATIMWLLSENKQYGFCERMLEIREQLDERMQAFLFYIIGHLILNEPQLEHDSELLAMFCKISSGRFSQVEDLFEDEKHLLYTSKIFDKAIDESGKADKDTIELHADFKRKYLKGVVKERKIEDAIEYNKIVKKEMFYNGDTTKQIKDLTDLLQRSKFNTIKKRLIKSGTRTGFTCLFSGGAGTGKTETCLQIAKATKRAVIKVDIAQLRSKWWGEDERNIKAIFNNYKNVLQESRIEPILLFNEADAILGKRLDVTGNNGAIITSINAVQNIILEELENFEGILIATTNLTQNMDKAFERRFLYKITFEKPDTETRVHLWRSILKIDEQDAQVLASKYDYTGAEIENIFRKKTVDSILYDKKYDLETIIKLAAEEKIEKDRPIGFGN